VQITSYLQNPFENIKHYFIMTLSLWYRGRIYTVIHHNLEVGKHPVKDKRFHILGYAGYTVACMWLYFLFLLLSTTLKNIYLFIYFCILGFELRTP
jgi:hypothetical protein